MSDILIGQEHRHLNKQKRNTMENVTLNKVELASDLASDRLEAEFEGQIYDEPTAGITVYTDEAQEVFDQYYDRYLELIENCQQYCESIKEYNI